jgi:hypothetical protein
MLQHKVVFRGLVSLLLFSLPFARANGQMTHEETVVRQTYAKLAYAVKLGTIHDALSGDPQLTRVALDARIEKEKVVFQLANFSSGKLSDIATRSYGDLVTKPDGSDVLSITTGNLTDTETNAEGQTKTIEVQATVMGWRPGPEISGSFDIPVATAVSMMENAQWYSRYAAFTVTALFQGRSRTVHAIFLFGANAQGIEQLLVADTIAGTAVGDFGPQTVVYPAILLKTSYRARPVVADWLKSQQVFDAACKPGKEEVCCNPATLECGVAAQDVNSSLSKPVPVSQLTPASKALAGLVGGPRPQSNDNPCAKWTSSTAGTPTLSTAVGTDHGHITGHHGGWRGFGCGHVPASGIITP